MGLQDYETDESTGNLQYNFLSFSPPAALFSVNRIFFALSFTHTHTLHARTTHTLTDRPDSSHHLKHAPLLFPCLLLDLNHYIISLSLSLSTSRTTSCPCVLLLPLCLLPQIGFYFHSCSVLLTYFLCSLASPTFIYALITTINTTIIMCGTITHYAFILLSSLLLGLVSSLSLFINPSSLITADFVFRHFTILLSLLSLSLSLLEMLML